MKSLLCSLVVCLLFASGLRAESLITLQLDNRTAEELIPIIQPMLGPADVITGYGYKIFLRAPAQTVTEVEYMISALDVAAKMLQISVFQGSKRKLETLSVSGKLQIDGDNGSVSVGNSNSGAGNINYEGGNSSASVSSSSKRLSKQNNPVYRLRVAEGKDAFIQTGEQVPYFAGDDGTVYQDVTSGFYVLPRTHGDSVTLEVSPFKNALSNSPVGSIETQSARTTITGRMGEWLQVGSVTEQASYSQSGIASYSSGNSKRKDRIWIRADLLP